MNIIDKTDKIDKSYLDDIEMYMDEFGFDKFEILKISKSSRFFNNLIVFALGILEICVGAVLIYTCANPKMLKFAKFLIRDGIDNVIESIKSTIEGKEINLKDFAKKKAVKLLYFALELITGMDKKPVETSFKKVLFEEIKEKCERELINYGSSKAAGSLMNLINEKLSEAIKNIIMKIDLNENSDKYIINDIINNEDKYKHYVFEKIKIILGGANSLKSLMPLIDTIKNLTNKNKTAFDKLSCFYNFIKTFDFQELRDLMVNCVKIIKNSKADYKVNKDADLFNISNILKNIDRHLTEEKIDNICKEFVECGAITYEKNFFNTKWKFAEDFKNYIDDKNIEFPNLLDLKLENKYTKIECDKTKKLKDIYIL